MLVLSDVQMQRVKHDVQLLGPSFEDRELFCADFTYEEKRDVNKILGRIERQLRQMKAVQHVLHVKEARIPVLKVGTPECPSNPFCAHSFP